MVWLLIQDIATTVLLLQYLESTFKILNWFKILNQFSCNFFYGYLLITKERIRNRIFPIRNTVLSKPSVVVYKLLKIDLSTCGCLTWKTINDSRWRRIILWDFEQQQQRDLVTTRINQSNFHFEKVFWIFPLMKEW